MKWKIDGSDGHIRAVNSEEKQRLYWKTEISYWFKGFGDRDACSLGFFLF